MECSLQHEALNQKQTDRIVYWHPLCSEKDGMIENRSHLYGVQEDKIKNVRCWEPDFPFGFELLRINGENTVLYYGFQVKSTADRPVVDKDFLSNYIEWFLRLTTKLRVENCDFWKQPFIYHLLFSFYSIT